MSTQTEEARIPALTLGWRLKMALGFADISAQEMADYLGMSRQTLSRWMGDTGTPPARSHVLTWAMRTGVDSEWLERGTDSGPGGGEVSPTPRYMETRTPTTAALYALPLSA